MMCWIFSDVPDGTEAVDDECDADTFLPILIALCEINVYSVSQLGQVWPFSWAKRECVGGSTRLAGLPPTDWRADRWLL